MPEAGNASKRFHDLTWKDLERWAGSRIFNRGRTCHREGRVQDLAVPPDGSLVASVKGSSTYATRVWCDEDALLYACTCSYDGVCKHAVAVVLGYLGTVWEGEEVPAASGDDERIAVLKTGDPEEAGAVEGSSAMSSQDVLKEVGAFLEGWSPQRLREFILDLAARDSGILHRLTDRSALSSGREVSLVEGIRRDLKVIAEGPSWDPWKEDDCSEAVERLEERLAVLLEHGRADEVVELGIEILRAANRFEEAGRHEWQAEEALTGSMKRVFEALLKGTLPPAGRLVLAVDLDMEDAYGLCAGGLEAFWSKQHTREAWSGAADVLLSRLSGEKAEGTRLDQARGRRSDLVDWTIRALEKAGRSEEIIPLCEQEAAVEGSYPRLVERLIGLKRWKEAESWAWRGIEEAQGGRPGKASDLRRLLRRMHEELGNWEKAASLRAEDFFRDPSKRTYAALEHAAQQAGVWPPVREAVLGFLETGVLPWGKKAWPLEKTRVPVLERAQQQEFPALLILLDVAMWEDRPADALALYDRIRGSFSQPYAHSDSLATAVAGTFPERAVEIWQRSAEAMIARTKPAAYAEAMTPLKKIRDLLGETGKEQVWNDYLAGIRKRHRRKRRLMEMLDNLEGKPVAASGSKS